MSSAKNNNNPDKKQRTVDIFLERTDRTFLITIWKFTKVLANVKLNPYNFSKIRNTYKTKKMDSGIKQE